jgi:DNA invertase Pin-like site-specific DNA recombinase
MDTGTNGKTEGTCPLLQTIRRRARYQQLRQWIREGKVGCIFVSDSSRLGRNAAERLQFRADCAAHGLLMVVDGVGG